VILLRGRVVVYGEVWFEEEPPANAAVDIVVYRYRRAPIANARTTPLHSLCTDLCGPSDAIAAQFNATCRRHIRHAEAKDGLRHEVIAEAEAVDGLEEFSAFYDTFARQKVLRPADRHWLARAAAERRLVLSCASRDGTRLVWHAHLRSGRTVSLAYSASWFRGMDGDYRSLVGRANRWLHWRDMLCFQEAGVHCYDWGGMFENESTPERAGINRFKRDFGGQPVHSYECTVAASARGRIWLSLRDAWRGWQRAQPPAALGQSS
jgi:hypothetical protein